MDAAAPLDPTQAAKTRARRRLIGAIALALAAVVFVPMLFDRTPVAPSDDIAVQIPDRDTPFEGRRGVLRDGADAGKGPLRPSSALPSPAASPAVGQPASTHVDVAPAPVASVDASKSSPVVVNESSNEKPVQKAVEKSGEKGIPSSSAAQGDDPRALAALEGKAVPQAASESASGKGFAVQIAAFSIADKAKNLRDQLNASGLKAYTEPLSTPQGLRTRVRLGPFASREAAERARQRLRTMKLDGSVVTL